MSSMCTLLTLLLFFVVDLVSYLKRALSINTRIFNSSSHLRTLASYFITSETAGPESNINSIVFPPFHQWVLLHYISQITQLLFDHHLNLPEKGPPAVYCEFLVIVSLPTIHIYIFKFITSIKRNNSHLNSSGNYIEKFQCCHNKTTLKILWSLLWHHFGWLVYKGDYLSSKFTNQLFMLLYLFFLWGWNNSNDIQFCSCSASNGISKRVRSNTFSVLFMSAAAQSYLQLSQLEANEVKVDF